MGLTGPEIRHNVLKELSKQKSKIQPQLDENQKVKMMEVSNALREMVATKGWKLLEEWMTIQMDIGLLLFEEDAKKKDIATIKARAYAETLLWVEDSAKFGSVKGENDE